MGQMSNGDCEKQDQWAERHLEVRTSTQDLPFQYAQFIYTNIPTISCYYKDYGYLICKHIISPSRNPGQEILRASLGNPLSWERFGSNNLSSSAEASQEDDTVGSSRGPWEHQPVACVNLGTVPEKTWWLLESKSPNSQSQSPFADGDQHRGSRWRCLWSRAVWAWDNLQNSHVFVCLFLFCIVPVGISFALSGFTV